jgi:flavoprotein
MKDACEDCGAKPELPEYADEDLVECHGCGKTICMNDCVWSSEVDPERYWCCSCTDKRGLR